MPFFKGNLFFNWPLSQGYLLLAAPFLKSVWFLDTLFQRCFLGQTLSQRCGAAMFNPFSKVQPCPHFAFLKKALTASAKEVYRGSLWSEIEL